MSEQILAQIAQELGLGQGQVRACAQLLDEGATVPFVARYRKEMTGSLDEVAILAVRDRLGQLRELEARREAILKSLAERELLTPELEGKIQAAATMAILEDLYLPFRPKRRTRGMMAKEKGLEPLALLVWEQDPALDPLAQAAAFVDAEKGVDDPAQALAGARDIMAEWINEDAGVRAALRQLFEQKAVMASKVITGQEEAGAKFKDYFAWEEPAAGAAGHRVLAMRRGEKEGHLLLRVLPPQDQALPLLTSLVVKNGSPAGQEVGTAASDAYKRLLAPALETELRLALKERADLEAVKVFAANLRELLLAAPLGQKRVLAIDPGFRTGCKLACLDAQGRMLHHDLINILTPRQLEEAGQKISALVAQYAMEAIAIGNGTASRETEALVRGLELPRAILLVVVSEAGASVYSASEVARQEFPDLDVSVRGAVSIGRRLMDPLAELVKIDPKSIGVGQYQHDVDQGELKRSLEDVVTSCVNAVGVEVNTASPQLLAYVSGLGPALAKAIVAHREQNGPFQDRRQLLKVPRLGPKAFEQAAGFLRIRGGVEPLDASAVHPESYPLVQAMARDLGATVSELLRDQDLRRRLEPQRYVSADKGLPTITDILGELDKPGRDPRQAFEAFAFAEGVHEMKDLEPGMRLPGIVTNVTNFGAFVDVGVHQDGLVHISQLAERYVSDPHQVVKVADRVMVTVLEVDLARGRISLSMRQDPQAARRGEKAQPQERPPDRRGQKPAKPPAPAAPAAFNNPFAKALGRLGKD
ncbi:MAG: RNA-binding transcriptional accessory protein [Desulfarculus sp.]|nr:RNA-binding transcriptional accessory protein [Desulfarculus sp.]